MARRRRRRTVRGPLLALLVCAVVVEIGWTIFLGVHLPRHYVALHWDLAWVGIDVMEIALLCATAWTAWRMKVQFIIFASVTGTVFVLDAWFDITTARRGDLIQSALLASVTEIPLAIALFWTAWRATRWFIVDAQSPLDADSSGGDHASSAT